MQRFASRSDASITFGPSGPMRQDHRGSCCEPLTMTHRHTSPGPDCLRYMPSFDAFTSRLRQLADAARVCTAHAPHSLQYDLSRIISLCRLPRQSNLGLHGLSHIFNMPRSAPPKEGRRRITQTCVPPEAKGSQAHTTTRTHRHPRNDHKHMCMA